MNQLRSFSLTHCALVAGLVWAAPMTADAALSVVQNTAPASVNLTTAGNLGCAKFSIAGDTNFSIPTIVQKAGGTPITFTNSNPVSNGGNGQFGTELGTYTPTSFSWTDGNSVTSGTNDQRKIQLDAVTPGTQNATLNFSVPSLASDTVFHLYLGLFAGTASFTATVFGPGNLVLDTFTKSDLTPGTNGSVFSDYALTFSGGERLDVSYKLTAAQRTTYSSVQVAAATLASVPEPSSALLLTLGAGFLGCVRRRVRAGFSGGMSR